MKIIFEKLLNLVIKYLQNLYINLELIFGYSLFLSW